MSGLTSDVLGWFEKLDSVLMGEDRIDRFQIDRDNDSVDEIASLVDSLDSEKQRARRMVESVISDDTLTYQVERLQPLVCRLGGYFKHSEPKVVWID